MSNQVFFAVTTSDTVLLPFPIRSLWIGVSGDVAVFGAGDTTATVVKGMPAASWIVFPAPVVQIGATGTTATNMAGSSHTIQNTST